MLRLPCKPSRIFMDSSLRPSNLTIERSGYRWTSDRAFDQQLGRSKDLSFKSSRSNQIVNSWKKFFFLGHETTGLKFTGFISSNFDPNAERENTRGWCCWYDSTSEWEYWTFPSPSPYMQIEIYKLRYRTKALGKRQHSIGSLSDFRISRSV